MRSSGTVSTAALAHHLQTNFAAIIGPLEAPDAGLGTVCDALERWGGLARGPGAGVGCLLCNTASERAAFDPAAQGYVREYVDRMTGGFHNALGNALSRGETITTLEVDDEARFLTSHVVGQLTLVRSNVAPEVVEASARMAIAHVAALATDPATRPG